MSHPLMGFNPSEFSPLKQYITLPSAVPLTTVDTLPLAVSKLPSTGPPPILSCESLEDGMPSSQGFNPLESPFTSRMVLPIIRRPILSWASVPSREHHQFAPTLSSLLSRG